ncbi:MAG: hypothetical protein HYV25_01005 [Candidatus Harrisonbacteria bacterium]|nr:hypothetical protein [Candidatus Harrisonbacteria bacterium]
MDNFLQREREIIWYDKSKGEVSKIKIQKYMNRKGIFKKAAQILLTSAVSFNLVAPTAYIFMRPVHVFAAEMRIDVIRFSATRTYPELSDWGYDRATKKFYRIDGREIPMTETEAAARDRFLESLKPTEPLKPTDVSEETKKSSPPAQKPCIDPHSDIKVAAGTSSFRKATEELARRGFKMDASGNFVDANGVRYKGRILALEIDPDTKKVVGEVEALLEGTERAAKLEAEAAAKGLKGAGKPVKITNAEVLAAQERAATQAAKEAECAAKVAEQTAKAELEASQRIKAITGGTARDAAAAKVAGGTSKIVTVAGVTLKVIGAITTVWTVYEAADFAVESLKSGLKTTDVVEELRATTRRVYDKFDKLDSVWRRFVAAIKIAARPCADPASSDRVREYIDIMASVKNSISYDLGIYDTLRDMLHQAILAREGGFGEVVLGAVKWTDYGDIFGEDRRYYDDPSTPKSGKDLFLRGRERFNRLNTDGAGLYIFDGNELVLLKFFEEASKDTSQCKPLTCPRPLPPVCKEGEGEESLSGGGGAVRCNEFGNITECSSFDGHWHVSS